MKTKLIACLLLLATLVLAFASCGGGENPPACEHTAGANWVTDATNHWHTCSKCSAKMDEAAHTFADNVCSVCAYVKTDVGGGGDNPEPVVEYPWDPADTFIKFEISNDSNGGELASRSKRYIAGTTGEMEDIDQMVAERNIDALDATNIGEVKWQYLEDGKGHGWGQNTRYIYELVYNESPHCPDIFTNYVYDITCASLQGVLKNLNSTGEGTGDLAGLNYFEFAPSNNPDFVDTGKGYMYEYMWSLTLSKSKMYALSSDYFTDMVRAFYVIPVNSNIMNNNVTMSAEEGKFNSDRNGDGVFNMKDFFELVWANQWNYETMAEFCFMVKKDESSVVDPADNGGTYNLNDRVGFALDAVSGLCSSGMLYSTNITIINRVPNDQGDYDVSYPDKNPDLTIFCNNLKKLFETEGVISVSTVKNQTYGFKTEGGTGSGSDAIRERFTKNKVLFGNVICVGAIEEVAYQNMTDGFGVAPVPLYRTNYVDANGQVQVDKYLTQVHNLGRIGAIADCSDKFVECSAYLNYQSLNSNEILNEYYEAQLKGKYANDETVGKDNAKMLDYIRSNVRTAFDKTFEDAVAFYIGEGAGENKWHEKLCNTEYKFDGMTKFYDDVIAAKQQGLRDLYYAYHNTFQ